MIMKTKVDYTEVLSKKFNELHKTLNEKLEEKVTNILFEYVVKSEALGWHRAYEQLLNVSNEFTTEELHIIDDINAMLCEEGEFENGYEYMEEPILIEALINYDSGFSFEPQDE